MLKTRVMPTLLFRDHGLVKGEGFDSWRRVGTALQSVRVYNLREVDELVFLDIGARLNGRKPDFMEIDEIADNCHMPLTVGGGVSTIEDFRSLLAVGADKVAVNTAAIDTPELVRDAAREFGTQCVVVSIDARRGADGACEVFAGCGKAATGRDPVAWAREVEALGAGEILLCSVERDGTMTGYDVELVRDVAAAVGIPVIASGGCGSYEHMAQVLAGTRAAALAASAIFQFTEQTPLEAKRYLAERGFPMRL
jgi:imidazole glycerol-phosphate synthase subunit HisF